MIASDAPVEWNEASALRTAAQLLSDEIVTGSAARVPVEAVLMLVGGTIAQSLAAFSQRERIPVVHFKDYRRRHRQSPGAHSSIAGCGLGVPVPTSSIIGSGMREPRRHRKSHPRLACRRGQFRPRGFARLGWGGR